MLEARALSAGVTAFPPCRYLLCASGDFVKVYSVNTEETLRLMGGHADLVTGIQLNPHNHMQVCGGRSGWGWSRVPMTLTWLRGGCPGAGWSLGVIRASLG